MASINTRLEGIHTARSGWRDAQCQRW